MVASFEKTEANLEYSEDRVGFGLAFSASMVSLVVVVRDATWRVVKTVFQEAAPHWIAQCVTWLSEAPLRYSDSKNPFNVCLKHSVQSVTQSGVGI